MSKVTAMDWVQRVLGIATFLIMTVAGLKSIFAWNWHQILSLVLVGFAGLWMLGQIIFIVGKAIFAPRKIPKALFFVAGTVLGAMLLFMAPLQLDYFADSIGPRLMKFQAIVMFLAGVWGTVQSFVKVRFI